MADTTKITAGNTKITIEWDDDGFKEILNSSELGTVCLDAARRIAEAAGENYTYEAWHSNMKGGRIAARVICANEQGAIDEARERTLSKAAMSCRT